MLWVALIAAFIAAPPQLGYADSLRGSKASLDRQNRIARQHDFTYIDTPSRLRYFASRGWLVSVRGNRHFRLHGVSYPYARPEVKLFVERLAEQYHSACGRQLVVTSLTRPTTRQPRNASDRSVHPTGMALDLRYSRDRGCRRWIQRVLLDLERAGVLDATLERRPIHYHVALFPRQYAAYVQNLDRQQPVIDAVASYRVQRGDSLWTIARSYGTTVRRLRRVNDMRGSRIYAGQVLQIPDGS